MPLASIAQAPAKSLPVIMIGETPSPARAGRLGSDKDEAARAEIVGQVERLVGAEEMGTLFKVIAVTPPGLTVPGLSPFDRSQARGPAL